MFKYTKIYIYTISLIVSIIIFILFNYMWEYKFKSNDNSENLIIKNQENINKDSNWQIDIPKIELFSEIKEGKTIKFINNDVEHVEYTSKTNGNIGIIINNKDIKKLRLGDEIIYKYEKFEKIYIIDTIEIIKDTDWSYLEETEENIITLIASIEKQPEYRRCIQAVEKIQNN